jgi:hypothetical protein
MDPGPSGYGVNVQGAHSVLAAFVAHDPHHGLFAPCEPRRHRWR